MPYSLRKKNSKCWEVINTQSGKVHSKCTSKKKGEAQIRLLEQLASQEGAGWFGDLISKVIPKKRAAGVLPRPVRKILESIGNEPITSLVVVRTPLDKFLTGLVNVISLGDFSKAMKANSYDSMFHLTLFINNKYQYEKLEVVSLKTGNPIKKKSETAQVNIPAGWNATIQQFIDKHKLEMGDETYSDYNAFTNNCQDFLISALKANGLLTSELQGFIKQPIEGIVKNIPSWTGKVSKAITDAAARVNRLIYGEAIKGGLNPIPNLDDLIDIQQIRRDIRRAINDTQREINRGLNRSLSPRQQTQIQERLNELSREIRNRETFEELEDLEADLIEFLSDLPNPPSFLQMPNGGAQSVIKGKGLKEDINEGLKLIDKSVKKIASPELIAEYNPRIQFLTQQGYRMLESLTNNPNSVDSEQVLDWLGDIDLAFGDLIDQPASRSPSSSSASSTRPASRSASSEESKNTNSSGGKIKMKGKGQAMSRKRQENQMTQRVMEERKSLGMKAKELRDNLESNPLFLSAPKSKLVSMRTKLAQELIAIENDIQNPSLTLSQLELVNDRLEKVNDKFQKFLKTLGEQNELGETKGEGQFFSKKKKPEPFPEIPPPPRPSLKYGIPKEIVKLMEQEQMPEELKKEIMDYAAPSGEEISKALKMEKIKRKRPAKIKGRFMEEDEQKGGFLPILAATLAPMLLGKLFGSGQAVSRRAPEQNQLISDLENIIRQLRASVLPDRVQRIREGQRLLREVRRGLTQALVNEVQVYWTNQMFDLEEEPSVQQGGFLPLLAGILAPTLISKLFGGAIVGGMNRFHTEDEMFEILKAQLREQGMSDDSIRMIARYAANVYSPPRVRPQQPSNPPPIQRRRRPNPPEEDEKKGGSQGSQGRRKKVMAPRAPAPPRSLELTPVSTPSPVVASVEVPSAPPRIENPSVQRVLFEEEKKGGAIKRKASSWVSALKEWNNKKGGKYTIPKKGTKEYEQVRKLMK
jgi:hypothetical protein